MLTPFVDPSVTLLGEQVTTPQSEPDASTVSTEPKKKWAGKYDNPEELEKGYRNSAEETQRIIARERLKDQEIASLKMQIQGRVNPAEQSASRRNPVDDLTEAMVPVDALGAFVQSKIAEAFEPIARGMAARTAVGNEYKDFSEVEGELNTYLAANPEFNERYQRMLQSDAEGAMELLYHRWKSTVAKNEPGNDLSGQEQATNRAVAALTGTATGPRSAGDSYAQKLAIALQHFKDTGDEGPYLRVRLIESGVIPESQYK